MTQKVYNILILCTGNSARSIIAEAIINRYGKGRFKGYSAGSQPKGEVHPYALDVLGNQGYSVQGLRSKNWEEFSAPEAPDLDFVFTVCDNAANEVCPLWPGQPMSAHWGMPDPAAAQGSEAEVRYAFAEAVRTLKQRLTIFMNLPIDVLDKMALQKELDEIGQTAPDPADTAQAS